MVWVYQQYPQQEYLKDNSSQSQVQWKQGRIQEGGRNGGKAPSWAPPPPGKISIYTQNGSILDNILVVPQKLKDETLKEKMYTMK